MSALLGPSLTADQLPGALVIMQNEKKFIALQILRYYSSATA